MPTAKILPTALSVETSRALVHSWFTLSHLVFVFSQEVVAVNFVSTLEDVFVRCGRILKMTHAGQEEVDEMLKEQAKEMDNEILKKIGERRNAKRPFIRGWVRPLWIVFVFLHKKVRNKFEIDGTKKAEAQRPSQALQVGGQFNSVKQQSVARSGMLAKASTRFV